MTNIDNQLETAARIVSESSYLIALVGAGMSKESGIPTFRGGDGLWDKHGEPPMDGYQRMLADPAAWWAERQVQRQSQAGDELTRAIEEAITEIHGNRTKMRCVNCVRRWGRDEFVPKDMPPRCPDCEGLVKSDTVMFGEPIPPDALESCFREAQRADAVLLLGTSAAVYPAAEFPVIVYRNGGKLIEVNPQETPLSELCSAVLRAPSGHVLPALLEEVGKLDTGS